MELNSGTAELENHEATNPGLVLTTNLERRIERTLVTVNLVSRRLVVNRCWRKIDRYLLTVDDSTVSLAVDRPRTFISTLLPFPFSFQPFYPIVSTTEWNLVEVDVARLCSVLVCGPVLGLLMNTAGPGLAIRHRAWWKDC